MSTITHKASLCRQGASGKVKPLPLFTDIQESKPRFQLMQLMLAIASLQNPAEFHKYGQSIYTLPEEYTLHEEIGATVVSPDFFMEECMASQF